MKTVGFIGIGVMGKSMARNLKQHGFDVAIHTRTKAKAQELIDEGFVWCDSVADCARDKDAVITIVGYPQDVEEVYFGENGIIEHAKQGAYLIDMTTTSPRLSERIYAAAVEKGLFALDAPVSGGDVGAKNGTLAIMVGGDAEAFAACQPLFRAMGSSIIHEGGPGCGQHVKMANQIAIAGAVTGVAEAVSYAKTMGVDPMRMIETISGGAASSWQLKNLGPKMANGNVDPGFFIKHFIKDMSLAKGEAEQKGLELAVLSTVREMYLRLEEEGCGELGTQAIIHHYENK